MAETATREAAEYGASGFGMVPAGGAAPYVIPLYVDIELVHMTGMTREWIAERSSAWRGKPTQKESIDPVS